MMIYLNLRSGYYFQWFMISSIQTCRSLNQVLEIGNHAKKFIICKYIYLKDFCKNRRTLIYINGLLIFSINFDLSMFLLYILNFKKLIFL